jgi:hypothetical protein
LRRKKRPSYVQTIAKGHRIVGVISAGFVLLLAITGMMLNHTDTLGLDQRFVHSRILQAWYGMVAPDVRQGYALGDAWITQWQDSLYYNERPLSGRYAALQGAVALGDERVVALADGILLLDPQGNIVEEIRASQDLPPVSAIGEWNGRVVLRRGGEQFVADPMLSTWTRTARQKILWASASNPPPALLLALRQDYQDRMLNSERVVRDIHNGRILGSWGALWMDSMALAFIGMALTGAWMAWQRRNGAQPARKKPRKSTG